MKLRDRKAWVLDITERLLCATPKANTGDKKFPY